MIVEGVRHVTRAVRHGLRGRSNQRFTVDFVSGHAGLRTLVVGVGQMGSKLAAMLDAMGYEVVGVCDRSEGRLGAVRTIVPDARPFGDVEEVDPEQLDVAVVATLADSHAALLTRLVEAGVRRIVCEKPVANTVEDIATLRELSRRPDVRISVHHPRRWSPDFRAIRAVVAEGRLGQLRGISAYAKAGGFGNIGSHYIDTALFLSGARIISVTASLERVAGSSSRGAGYSDPNGAALFQLDTGAVFTLDTAHDQNGANWTGLFTLSFERGQIEIWERAGIWYLSDYAERTRTRHSFVLSMKSAILKGSERSRMLDALIGDLMSGRDPDSLLHACDAAEAIIAAQNSSKHHGREIRLPLDPGTPTIHRFS